ncbi:MAG: hypothetical protein ACR2OY_04290 [Boseongicola sp.]
MSPERAADYCEDRARYATGPIGGVHIGLDTHGHMHTGLAIGVTSDYLRGSDPEVVYEDCVWQKTGQAPIRPLVM